jgi:hypothetical protein
MMSDVRYEIKNFITWTLDFEIWHKNLGRSVRNELTVTKLILVDPVDDEEEIRVLRLPIPNWQCAI